jgi:hypothetical protein
MDNNIRNLRTGTNKFNRGFQHNMSGRRDLFGDSHSILNRWKKHFCQSLNVCGVDDVKHSEIHRF